MVDTEQVFVYGTLRPPQSDTPPDDSRYYPNIVSHIRHVAPARLSKADLYTLGTYPAARPGSGLIVGDLLTVEPAALPIMDRIEGHPTFFQRDKVTVQTETSPVEAWIYWAPPGMVIGRRKITGGDWFKRARNDSLEAEDFAVDESNIDETLLALVKRFAQAECSWLSSVRPDGRAHSAPIWHVWYRGRAYVVAQSTAVKTVNILENPNVVITHPDPVSPVIIEGWGTPAPALQSRLQPLFESKYNWNISTDPDYDTVIEITPTKLIAWGDYGQGRWPGIDVLQVWSI